MDQENIKLKKLVQHKIISKKDAAFLLKPSFDISNIARYTNLIKKIKQEYPILAIKPKS